MVLKNAVVDRKLAAILAADVVGYSALMERDGQAGGHARMWAGVHFRSDVVGCGRAGHNVRGSTAPAVGATLAFAWGLRGAKHYGAVGSVVLSPELSEKVAEAHGGESDCQPSM